MSKKRAIRAKANTNVVNMNELRVSNGRNWSEPVKRKTWTRHDLKTVKPITHPLQEMYSAFIDEELNIFAHGSAGTGKTLAGIWLAMNEILNPDTDYDRLILVRSSVPSREIGFLPGTEEEKMAVYERPYQDIFADLFGRTATYNDMKEAGLIEFMSSSFIRGLTWNNAIVVVDEGQNLTFEEINTVMTRVGKNTRVMFLGDLPQKDLKKKGDETGFPKALKVAALMPQEFASVVFTRHDILRSGFVKAWITSVEDVDSES